MIFKLFTDGACQPNPGNGGWAFIVDEDGQDRVEKSGFEKQTTNNRMEIRAVLEGFSYIKSRYQEDDSIILCSDSKYVLNGLKTWMHNWVKKNWTKSDKKPVVNDDLWKEIYFLSQNFQIEYEHIHGHTGHLENEKCDELAVTQIAENRDV